MELSKNLVTESGWEIRELSFNEELLVNNGSNYLTGNGYLGYRGTFPEWTKEQYVGCTVSDTYDTADGKWKELCTVPNGLFTRVSQDGQSLSLFSGSVREYERELNVRYGIHRRRLAWEGAQASLVTEDERFASYANLHLIPSRYTITAERGGALRLDTGIDGDVWSLHGDHFSSYEPFGDDGKLFMRTVTGEHGIEVVVGEALRVLIRRADGEIEELSRRDATAEADVGERHILRKIELPVSAGDEIVLEKFMAVYHTNDGPGPLRRCREALEEALEAGYAGTLEAHKAVWDEKWRRFDIEIEGDLKAQTLLRYNLYQNVIATPAHTDHLPIGARGLSCQAYQGAAFWDEEIFNLPMFLYTEPETARRILTYRYKTLDGAREKAKNLGYYGAFYAWISGDSGQEICPSYFFKDVLSGRPIRNHFNDWQIHISPDVAYAVWHYYRVTGDYGFLKEQGAEMLFEIARFLVSHAYFKKDKDRYEFIRLLGPDEYHENVDNNFFTAYQARFTVECALRSYEMLESEDPEALRALSSRIGLDEGMRAAWREMRDKLYIKQPDAESKVIEQFDGFFDLEDTTPEKLAERLKDPGEYWGWPNGIATSTQVSKQADVVQLFMLHPNAYPEPVMRANWDYYEPRTQHGSSLSPSVYGTVAAWLGYTDLAYRYFLHSATVDLFSTNKSVSGGTFIGGIHTAACGAAWQMVVHGFLGMQVPQYGVIRFAPRLPEGWSRLALFLHAGEARFRVEVHGDTLRLELSRESGDGCTVQLGGQETHLEPGQSVSFGISAG